MPKPYESDSWVIVSQTDWAAIGGWIYQARNYIASAGPCLKANGSDVEPPGTGVVRQ